MPTAERPGDLLLFAVSAWGQAPRDRLRQACDWLSAPAGDDRAPALARHTRAAALRALVALGHCDPTPAGDLITRPAYLTELPTAGCPQALACGARTPDTEPAVAAAADRVGAGLSVGHQPLPLAPARLLLTAASRTTLRELATSLRMDYHPVPASWAALTSNRKTLQTQQERLQWTASAELNWPRRDFDTRSCTFTDPANADTGEWRLSSYMDPTSQQPRHALWRGTRSAVTDRDWGRYLALYHRRRTVLKYSAAARLAYSPTSAPLPLELSRAFTQCSGLLPESIQSQDLDEVRNVDIYRDVPRDVYEEVARRLAPNR